jgi:hypothetical protein
LIRQRDGLIDRSKRVSRAPFHRFHLIQSSTRRAIIDPLPAPIIIGAAGAALADVVVGRSGRAARR